MLFIYTAFSSFVKKDYEIFKNNLKIKKFHYNNSKKLYINIIHQICLLHWLLSNIQNIKYIYIWFADYHSFLPILISKLMKIKSILVLGGYDVTYIPEINYGSFSNPFRSFLTKFSMKFASLCLPVSKYVQREAEKKICSINSKVIYNGIRTNESNYYKLNKTDNNTVLTVASCENLQRFKLKGIDKYIAISKHFKKVEFFLIGLSKNVISNLNTLPKNLKIYGRMDHKEIKEYYKKAKVYCQLSLVESFGIAVGEAMLYECIPVVSNVGGLKELINNTGFLINNNEIDDIVGAINKALNAPKSLGVKARKRIINNFSFRKRKKELLKILRD